MRIALPVICAALLGCNDVPFAPDPGNSDMVVLNDTEFFWPGDTLQISSQMLRGVELVPLDQNDFSTVGPWQNVSATLGDSTDVPLFKVNDSTLALPVGAGQAGVLDLMVRVDSTAHDLTPVTVGGILRSEDLPGVVGFALTHEPGEIVVAANPPSYDGLRVGRLGDQSISWLTVHGDYRVWPQPFGPSVNPNRAVVNVDFGSIWLSISVSDGKLDTLPCRGRFAATELGGGHCASVWPGALQIDDSVTIFSPSNTDCTEDDHFDASGDRKYFGILSDFFQFSINCWHPAIILDSLGSSVLKSDEYVSIMGLAFNGDTAHMLAPRSPPTYPTEVVLDSWDLNTGTLLSSRPLYVTESRGDLGGDVAISLDGKRAYVATLAGFWIVDLTSGDVRSARSPWPAPFSYLGHYRLIGSGSRNLMYGYSLNGNLTTWLLPEPVRSD